MTVGSPSEEVYILSGFTAESRCLTGRTAVAGS